MAAAGEITPMPTAAIFADTQAEPAAVYRHLDWLQSVLPFPVHRVSVGSLTEHISGAMRGENRIDARPPFFTGSGGMLNRQCTEKFKIAPIVQKTRELIGLKKGQRGPTEKVVETWIGISLDEAHRMKAAKERYIETRWPLIEKRMTRRDCLTWLASHQHPTPPKSACTFCPYHHNALWREMKLNDPESFAEAVLVDEAIRAGMPGPNRPEGEQWFVHRDRVPLAQVDLSSAEDRGQLNMFGNECEGVCGV